MLPRWLTHSGFSEAKEERGELAVTQIPGSRNCILGGHFKKIYWKSMLLKNSLH